MILKEIPMLDDEAREKCRQKAIQMVQARIGEPPVPEDQYGSEYPAWVVRMISVLMAFAFIGAALPSLFRLYSAGRDYFIMGINDPLQAAIVGLSTFLLAEFLVILSTISATVLFKGKARFIFVIPITMGLSMALVGNWTVVNPHDLFSTLEAVIPVFSVLFIALVGERLILHSIAARHRAQLQYRAALAEWRKAHSDPEAHPSFMGIYANALKAAIVRSYATGRYAPERRAALAALTPEQWRYLVDREMNAEKWYQEPQLPFGHTAQEAGESEDIKIIAKSNGHIVPENGQSVTK